MVEAQLYELQAIADTPESFSWSYWQQISWPQAEATISKSSTIIRIVVIFDK
jgi:hypothetical protein